MAVLDPNAPPSQRAVDYSPAAISGTVANTVASSVAKQAAKPDRPIRVEPLADLEWARAVEPTGPIGAARRPSQTRRAWIHRAPEKQVVALFTAASQVVTDMVAPWWLRALASGRLSSRLGGFAVEDQVSDLLESRPGWMYMPWTGPGEDGYWEYVPSESALGGAVPTTLIFTDRHTGWLDVFPAHTGRVPEPIGLHGPAQLRARLDELEQG
jgi:hypothetical protein